MRAGPAKRRRDAIEADIVRALEAVGASVARISAMDVPDLSVGYQNRNYWLEVKGNTKLRPGQLAWAQRWRGQTAVVRTVDEALKTIGAL